MNAKKEKPSYIISILANKCPRCREGHIYLSNNAYALRNNLYMKMHENCPVCGQPTDIEIGFYYGTSFVSYGITVLFSAISFTAWWLLIGFSIAFDDNRIFWWLGLNAAALLILQPVFMRLSRTLWLSWFVKYDPEWNINAFKEPERIVKEEMGNW